jgi:membrane peptidoglycan carboxypeptidase
MRKTAVMIGLMVLSVVLRVKGYLSGDNLTDLLKGTTIAFFSANGLEHMTSTIKEYVNSKGKKIDESIVDVKEVS